jgi:hypothetical protein
MKKITQTLEYDDDNRHELTANLSNWHKQHPLADQGVNWEFQYMWATMTDEDCLAFVLVHPQWADRFKDIT